MKQRDLRRIDERRQLRQAGLMLGASGGSGLPTSPSGSTGGSVSTEPPAAPINLAAGASGISVIGETQYAYQLLTWQRGSAAVPSAYTISYSDDGFVTEYLMTVDGTITSARVDLLDPDVLYDYRIRAISGTLSSTYSASVSATTANVNTPPTPSGLAVTAGVDELLIVWDAPPATVRATRLQVTRDATPIHDRLHAGSSTVIAVGAGVHLYAVTASHVDFFGNESATAADSDTSLTGYIEGTGTTGQVAYFTAPDTITSDAGLTWDNTTRQLTITTLTDNPAILGTNSAIEGRVLTAVSSGEQGQGVNANASGLNGQAINGTANGVNGVGVLAAATNTNGKALIAQAIGSATIAAEFVGSVDIDGALSLDDTGGTNHLLKQSTLGGVVTSGTLTDAEHGTRGGGTLHDVATGAAAGFMSSGDKTKLDGIGAGASVSSVALAAPSILTVSGSPITTSGTLTLALATQPANRVFAGPTTGADAAPTFRALGKNDLPAAIAYEDEANTFTQPQTVQNYIDLSEISPTAPAANVLRMYAVDTASLTLPAWQDNATTLRKAGGLACRARRTTNQSIATATRTAINLDAERYDRGGMHDNVTNNERITVPVAGLYHVGCNIQFAANATGRRIVEIWLNNTTVIARDDRNAVTTASAPTTLNIACDYQLAANDYVDVRVFQDSGGALDVVSSVAASPELWLHLIA